jgi:hypothetical protein
MTFPKRILESLVLFTLILFPSALFGQEQIASATKEKETVTKVSESETSEKKIWQNKNTGFCRAKIFWSKLLICKKTAKPNTLFR